MSELDSITRSLDQIEETLRKYSDTPRISTISVQELHAEISRFFPSITSLDDSEAWEDDNESESIEKPIWWDDLDEVGELEELHWLTKIQKLKLLSNEEVRKAMDDIEAGVIAQGVLDAEFLTKEFQTVERAKLLRVVEKGEVAFEEMIKYNLKLVAHVARRYQRSIAFEDRYSYGLQGLLRAVQKYDWRLGNQFSTYATWWIRQSISREIADTLTTIRLPVHAYEKGNNFLREKLKFEENDFTSGGKISVIKPGHDTAEEVESQAPPTFQEETDLTTLLSLDALAPSFDFWDVYFEVPELILDSELPKNDIEAQEYSDIAENLTYWLETLVLTEKELNIILGRHGYLTGDAMTLDELGQVFGLTRERIRQIESKALEKINKFAGSLGFENYWERIEEVVELFQEIKDAQIDSDRAREAKKRSLEENRARKLEELASMREIRRENQQLSSGEKLQVFEDANAIRSATAGLAQSAQLKWASERIDLNSLEETAREIVERRIKHPQFSLTELAMSFEDPAVTKDVVAGVIRRTINRATRESGQEPPTTN